MVACWGTGAASLVREGAGGLCAQNIGRGDSPPPSPAAVVVSVEHRGRLSNTSTSESTLGKPHPEMGPKLLFLSIVDQNNNNNNVNLRSKNYF